VIADDFTFWTVPLPCGLSAPQFRFIRIKNVLLSIDFNKTDESELQNTVENVVDNASVLLKEFNTSVVEYTSFTDTKSIPRHYWELLMKDSRHTPSSNVLEKCCLMMEDSSAESEVVSCEHDFNLRFSHTVQVPDDFVFE